MSRLPTYVQTAIETRLGLPLGLAAGYAKPGWCPRCGRAVIAGYDAPAIATLAIVDPHPATPLEEAAAIILGLPTWQLHGTPGRHQLSGRTWPGIRPITRHRPATECVVVIKHRCGFRPLATGPPIPTTNTTNHGFPENPPY
ncbi:hypothetical protein SAMN05216184_104120 [Georgenia satyanarayanai]|uniref:Uncharacterized protein n=1 Tax=Georgenia satyanarayanai TaxID=860221 RepID=A0A2Y9A7I5_9MICO|nr:hypothetical protein [Georgenia satyanarayanai]PYG00181.1 hypothetical protein A8987_104120 [Georgenia satyanarayanai]SSA40414.1 hypothetical protein SAMN05216184_104120 [Georgenia satyanarayanai]